ncbi:MAG TPA: GtrA family protein [Alphaproteobacteria bacterium]|nr:GtrA family protein [Alphaproteobacteria bacterium]
MRALASQFVKFGIVGAAGFLVDVAVLMFCMKIFGMGPYGGRLISFFVAATMTWIGNRLFTFRGLGGGKAHIQWAKFVSVSGGGFVLNYGAYAALVASVPLVHAHPPLGVAAGSIAGMFFNFFMARRHVFR